MVLLNIYIWTTHPQSQPERLVVCPLSLIILRKNNLNYLLKAHMDNFIEKNIPWQLIKISLLVQLSASVHCVYIYKKRKYPLISLSVSIEQTNFLMKNAVQISFSSASLLLNTIFAEIPHLTFGVVFHFISQT